MPVIRNKRTGETMFVPDAGPQMPANPEYPYKGPQAQANLNKTAADIRNDAERIELDRQRVRLEQERVAQQENTNRIAATAAEAPLIDRQTAVSNLENVTGDIQQQYNRNFKGAPRGWGGLTEMLPQSINPTNEAFNKRALQAGPFVQSILGLGGKDADAAAEYERKVMPFIPQAKNFDETNENTLRSLWDFIDAQKSTIAKKRGQPVPRPAYRYDRPPEQYGLENGSRTLEQEMARLNLNPRQRADAMRRYNADPRVTSLRGAPRKDRNNDGIPDDVRSILSKYGAR